MPINLEIQERDLTIVLPLFNKTLAYQLDMPNADYLTNDLQECILCEQNIEKYNGKIIFVTAGSMFLIEIGDIWFGVVGFLNCFLRFLWRSEMNEI